MNQVLTLYPSRMQNVVLSLVLTHSLTHSALVSQDVVDAVAFLHDSPAGTRVMCDSNSPDKLLTQFLVTNNGRLLLNDIDAAPLVDHTRGECRDPRHG